MGRISGNPQRAGNDNGNAGERRMEQVGERRAGQRALEGMTLEDAKV